METFPSITKLTAPLLLVQTQLQLHSKAKGAPPLPYTGMISGLRYTVQTTGIISIYRGLTPTLIGSIPKAGIRFGLNSVIKDLLRDPKTNHLTPVNNFFAGMGAGIAEAIIIVAPVETVKTKCIELNQPFVSGLQHIYQTEGVAGIYQGSFATALKQGSNQGLRFMWFNEYKRYVTTYYNVSGDGSSAPKMTPLQSLLGGMSAGCFSTLGNNPFDVVKTRMYVTEVLSLSHCRLILLLRCSRFSTFILIGKGQEQVCIVARLIVFLKLYKKRVPVLYTPVLYLAWDASYLDRV